MIYTLGDYVKLLSEEKLVTYENVDKNAAVEHISYNSRDVRPGTLFICKGAHFKAEYLADAEKAGAVCYVGEQRLGADFPCIIVSDVRRAISLISNKFFDKPWEKLSLIGITGTKGKSTTTYFMRYILDEYLKTAGRPRSGVISSIDTYDGVENFESHLTTPEAIELFRHFDNAVKSGIGYMTMEVSSQALKYGRVDCVSFDVGCYLNIGYDHISDIEHPDFEDYFHSKLKLFSKCKTACVCMDGERCDEVLKACRACERVITFSSIDKNADVFGYNIRKSGSDTVFDVRTPDFEGEFTLTIPGLFNVQNALAAIAICTALGIEQKYIYSGLMKARSDGRMEVYQNADSSVVAIVDYAHNKMSFESLFASVKKEFSDRKIYIVFGCPGNKAQNRRKDLGEIAGRFSDGVFLTEEDAGEESVKKICSEIAEFVRAEGCPCEIITDRGEAIRRAICGCRTPSVVLITGKGNETRQKRGREYIEVPSDVEYTKKALGEYDVEHNLDCKEKLNGLRELLPALKKLYNKKIVVKLGGSVMEDKELFDGIFDDISMLCSAGAKVVLVHGGGRSISAMCERLGIKTVFRDGYRITDSETAETAQMVLSGKINKTIIDKLRREGISAVGISGKDAGLIKCRRRDELGYVGEVTGADAKILELLLENGYVPVVSPVSADGEGDTVNVNADEAALAAAEALGADSLVFVTDVDGLLLDVNNAKTLVGEMSTGKARSLIEKGLVGGGMLPKLKSCISCIENGVGEVRILGGKTRYNLITSFISPEHIGTVISNRQ